MRYYRLMFILLAVLTSCHVIQKKDVSCPYCTGTVKIDLLTGGLIKVCEPTQQICFNQEHKLRLPDQNGIGDGGFKIEKFEVACPHCTGGVSYNTQNKKTSIAYPPEPHVKIIGNDEDPIENTEPNDSKSEANSLQFSKAVVESIGDKDDDDYHVLNFPVSGTFWFEISNLTEKEIENGNFKPVLCIDPVDGNEIGKAIGSCHEAFKPGDKDVKSNKLAVSRGSKCYIRISAIEDNIADYKLIARFIPDEDLRSNEKEPNDNKDESMDLVLGKNLKGSIGYLNDQSDCYRIKFPESGKFYFTVKNTLKREISNGFFQRVVCEDSITGKERANAQGSSHGSFKPGDEGKSAPILVSKGDVFFIKVAYFEKNRAYYNIETCFTPN